MLGFRQEALRYKTAPVTRHLRQINIL